MEITYGDTENQNSQKSSWTESDKLKARTLDLLLILLSFVGRKFSRIPHKDIHFNWTVSQYCTKLWRKGIIYGFTKKNLMKLQTFCMNLMYVQATWVKIDRSWFYYDYNCTFFGDSTTSTGLGSDTLAFLCKVSKAQPDQMQRSCHQILYWIVTWTLTVPF